MLWFDGAAFSKTGENGKIWSILLMILDLGDSFRNNLNNITHIAHIGNKVFC